MKNIIALGFTLLSFYAYSQQGTIRGTVIEDATGEPLFGVTVQIKGTTNGAVTDFDGKFQIKVEPGTYDLQASFVSFEPITITNLPVTAGEVYVIDQIRMKEDVEVLEEVVVTAEVIKTTESALLTVKKKSANLLDGISAASFRKIGDSDAASAVKRVTGVSVEGGKYVYVRGLGDRYTKTTLNNIDVPGLDPDKNSLQIDIFPTSLIQNMVVSKTALAEMPADFTGGVVNIETKDFPEERIIDVSFGISYNPSMHFNNEYITYDGSDTDWLGFDTDLRELPSGARGDLPQPAQDPDEEVLAFTKSFSPDFQNQQETSFMNYKASLTYGDQIELKNDNNLGYIFSLSYRADQAYYDDYTFGEYQLPPQSDDNDELIEANLRSGTIATDNRFLGGLAGIAYKTDASKFKLTAMRLQSGESKSGAFRVVEDVEDGRDAVGKSDFVAPNNQNLEYGERSITNFLLNGEHFLNGDQWVIDWKISPTFSSLKDPDIRSAALTEEFGFSFNAGAAGLPTRIWRFLDEVNVMGRVDVINNTELFGRDAKVKFGGSHIYKQRDYEILQYQLAFFGSQPDFDSPDLSNLLDDENLFGNDEGTASAYFQSNASTPNPNEYNSALNNTGFYASLEASPVENFKAIIGLRAENFVQTHTGRDQSAAQTISGLVDNGATLDEAIDEVKNNPDLGRVLDDDEVLSSFDLFPSLNTTYAVTEDQNLRFSYSRTIARPSFKELSFAQILDPVSDRTFNGGLFPFDTENDQWDGNLRETYINNFDLRWEIFLDRSQIYSVSVFYKTFEDPIELVRIPANQTGNELQVRNVGNSFLYGAEFEFRTALDILSPSLKNFFLNGNLTLTETVLSMTDVEFNGRKRFEREGEDIDDTRQMAGQAPYVINGGLSYQNFELGLEGGFFYNVQGPTLAVVGTSLFPDVFTEPFHSLNFNLNKQFGEDRNITINLSVENILDDRREEFFVGHDAKDQIFKGFSPGTTIGAGLTYSF